MHGSSSVNGEWIIAKKDRPKAKEGAKSRERREREGSSQRSNTTDSASAEDIPQYTSIPDMDMDEQRCILFFHGGKPSFSFNSHIVFGF